MRRRSRNRSTCASGSGKVPLSSTGFCVASIMNGLGRGCVTPSTVTPRSSIASRKADCVRGVARLISSARTMLANSGPGRNSNSPRLLVEDHRARHIGGQQVRGALHAREAQAQGGGDRAHQQRLGDAGNVVEQHVPVGQQGHRDQARLVGLADDDARHLFGDRAAQIDGRGGRGGGAGVVVYGEPPAVASVGVTLHQVRAAARTLTTACGHTLRR